PLLVFVFVLVILCAGVAGRSSVTSQSQSQSQTPSPSPTPRTREELPQDSDEVIKVETNLTNIFFTAADKNKRLRTKRLPHARSLKTSCAQTRMKQPSYRSPEKRLWSKASRETWNGCGER